MEKIEIFKNVTKKVKKFNLQGRTIEFKIKPVPDDKEPVLWMKEAVNEIILKGMEGVNPTDQIGFNFCSKDFKRGEGWLRFQEASKVTFDDIWDVISNIYQSNSTGVSSDTFCLGVTSVKMPIGKGKDRSRRYNTFDEECAMRRGIITIQNKDNLCLPRALVVAMAYVEKDPLYSKIRKDTGKIQTQKAISLLQTSGVSVPVEGCGITELRKFQQHLQKYKIVVYQYGNKGRDVIFEGPERELKISLLYHERHFNVITSLTAAFCCIYYCELCHIPYDNKTHHRCGGTCPACQESPVCERGEKIHCNECNRKFRGQNCFENHKKKNSKVSVCDQIRICSECLKTVKKDRTHYCGEYYCKNCAKHVPQDHLCYIQPNKGVPKTKDILFIFYDLETQQDTVFDQEEGSKLHVPNLCVFKQCCSECIDTNKTVCLKCGVRLQKFKCQDVISRFMYHILGLRKIFKKVVILAHNGQAFDHQFMLNYILTKTDLQPELIMRGTKIILMSIENVKFLDSMNYFPMKLADLPKAFGLSDSFKKGYFPHLFNTSVNVEYVGPLPAVELYSPDSMKENEREIFLKWYEEHKNDEFNMQRDLVDYCVSDVEILTEACLKFRKQLMDTTNVCPFTEGSTIASTCNLVYRRNFLQPNTIGLIPKNGYRWRDNQSKIAIQWIIWMEQQMDVKFLHAANQKEVVLHGTRVDAYCPDKNLILEFHGCFYHGHTCLKNQRDKPLNDDIYDTLNNRYESTLAKTERLRQKGYTVIEEWECNFRNNKEALIQTENHPLLLKTNLNPRDAFYGGRTGNCREYYKCGPDEKIKYVDVCSLYPWVCKYGVFPIGHPKVYVGHEECSTINLQKTYGLIKCKILPPTRLYHPVLPVKMNGKLMFVLCQTCGQTLNQQECQHTDKERFLTGTWVIDEVNKALDKGYKIDEIYEVWEYKTTQFDKISKTKGLFTDMMNKFIKIKQQASGWPQNCNTDEERNQYIEDYMEREDVKLEFAEIVENPGLRSLAKLILNSFWGKFGQRENQPKTCIENKSDEFINILTNPTINVNSILPINESTLIVNYEYIEEAFEELSTVNVVIASYVTAQARLKLYSYLEKLGERVAYFDTDSVIYISKSGEYDVPTGEFIGDMTDELNGDYGIGSYIKEFVCGGPKNYAYTVQHTLTKPKKNPVVCKVKGINLNYASSRIINFESMKKMILTPSDPVFVTSYQIRRTKEHQVISQMETKIYKPTSSKRCFNKSFDSVPYGFKRRKIE